MVAASANKVQDKMEHKMRYKNTFLELDIPKADLRRLETCPGRLDAVPKGAMMVLKEEKKPKKESWADMESDDEDVESELQSGPVKCMWADMDSDDETPRRRKDGDVDSDGFIAPAPPTPPEPEAETSPRSSNQAPVDDWCTVARKGKGKAQKEAPVAARPYVASRDKEAERPKLVLKPRPAPEAATRTPARSAPAPAAPRQSGNKQVSQRIDVNMQDGAFPVVRRLIGPGGANLRRIKEACGGAIVSLRGKGCPGSGPASEREGPLHIVINAMPQHLDAAVRMAKDLVADVRAERDNASASYGAR
jgi:hypothetical protein